MNQNSQKTYQADRLKALSDGIFAFAMTLLIINIDVPLISPQNVQLELGQKLLEMIPMFADFILSFALLAVFWIIHQKQYEFIKKVNEPLLWINILFLLSIVFVPFSTNLISKYDSSVIAVEFFNFNLFIVGIMSYVQWTYASRHGLIDAGITEEQLETRSKKNFVIIPVSIFAMILAFFSPGWCTLVYITIPIIIAYLERKPNKIIVNK
jgi:uncharacterized membrane protein